jgi:O-antigen/teichoic acid export membrane protein
MPPAAGAISFDVRRLLRWGSQGFWAISDQGLFAVSNLLVNVMLARWLRPAEYGAFATAYTVLLLVSGAHAALIIEPMMVFGPHRYRAGFSHYLQVLQRYHWRLMVPVTIGLVAVALGFTVSSQRLLGQAIAGLIVTAPFYLLSLLARRASYVVSNPRLAAFGGALNLTLTVVGLALLSRLSLLTVLSAQVLLGLATSVAALFILLSLRRATATPLGQADLASVWSAHWRYGRWSGAIGPLVWIQNAVYYFVLPVWGGLAAVGAFKALLNLVMPILQSDGALATLLMPEFVKRRRSAGGLAHIVTWASLGFAAEATIYGLMLLLFGKPLLAWVYGGTYQYDPVILGLLALLPLLNSQLQIFSCALRAREQPQAVLWATMLSVVTMSTVGVWAVVTRGVQGAIIGSLIGCGSQIVVMLWLLAKPVRPA